MVGISLRGHIDGEFIQKISNLATGPSDPAKAVKQALSSSTSSVEKIRGGLRVAAQSYVKALSVLNFAGSFVNFARSDLEKLSELTTEMTKLAEKATDENAGNLERRRLNSGYNQLGREFKNILKGSKAGDQNYLNVEDLEEVFKTVGLDRRDSKAVDEVLESFETISRDPSMVNPDIKGENTYLRTPIPAQLSHESADLFSATRDFRTPADAQAILDDLKALKSQIDNNLESLDGATEVLDQNLSLVRSTAIAMSTVSDEISSETDASEVARLVRQLVRQDASGAMLAQAANLEPIAVAALLLDEDDLLFS